MDWTRTEAKARFSELARRAQRVGPQRVLARGKATLVVMTETHFEALVRRRRRRSLAELLRRSPVAGLELDLSRFP